VNNTKRTNMVNNLNILKKKNGKELLNICNELIDNKIYVKNEFEVVKIKEDNLWNMDPFKNRSWRFSVNCLIMCEYLLQRFVFFLLIHLLLCSYHFHLYLGKLHFLLGCLI